MLFLERYTNFNSVLKAVNGNNNLPNLTRLTFQEIGFESEKRGNKALLIKREDDIIVWCCDYLRDENVCCDKMKRFRAQRRNIIYLDKTWVNEGHCPETVSYTHLDVYKRQVNVFT